MRTVPTVYPGSRRGFTLMETALAMVIIGLAVASMLRLLATGTGSNIAGNELTVAVNLANNIHEIAIGLAFTDPNSPTSTSTKESNLAAYNDIWDLNGTSLNPPVDCSGSPISSYTTWTQKVTVQTVDPNNLQSVRPNDPTVPTARITVVVLHSGTPVYTTSWIACAPDGP